MSNDKEAKSRIKINKLLEDAGWRFFDNEQGKANIHLESKAKIEELGDDFEQSKNGFIDFLLTDNDGKPLVVLEAKREKAHPLVGKEQARVYATSQKATYIILSNGNVHYLWNIQPLGETMKSTQTDYLLRQMTGAGLDTALGLLVIASGLALLGYVLSGIFWRWWVARRRRMRLAARRLAREAAG